MNDIIVRHVTMPTTIHGFTARDSEGDYNIYINDRIGYFKQEETIKHEIEHINRDDFEKDDVQAIEAGAHMKGGRK